MRMNKLRERMCRKNKGKFVGLLLAITMGINIMPCNIVQAVQTNYGLSNPSVIWENVNVDEISYKEYKKAKWNSLYFGDYWGNDTNGDGIADQKDDKMPIQWRVLSVNGTEALLISDKILDYQYFAEGSNETTWENSKIREWLNTEFYQNAFSATEKNAIITTTVTNPKEKDAGNGDIFYYYQWHYVETNTTMDKIYLPGMDLFFHYDGKEINDAGYGFENSYYGGRSMSAEDTDFARNQNPLEGVRKYDNSYWLRTQTSNTSSGILESSLGVISSGMITGNSFDCKGTFGVRPVLQLDLSKDVWKKGDDITYSATSNSPNYKICIYNELTLGMFDYDKDGYYSYDEDGICIVKAGEKNIRLDSLRQYTSDENNIEWYVEYGFDKNGNAWIRDDSELRGFNYELQKNDESIWWSELYGILDEDNPEILFDDDGDVHSEPNYERVLALLYDKDGYITGFMKANGEITDIAKYENELKKWVASRPKDTGKNSDSADSDENDSKKTNELSSSGPVQTEKDNDRNIVATGSSGNITTIELGSDKSDSNIGNLKKVKKFKVTVKKGRKVKLSWKKVSSAKGYQIQYSTNKKFKSKKSKTTKKANISIKNLKKKKTYYFRVRAYKYDMNGQKVYGSYSTVKKIKIKK